MASLIFEFEGLYQQYFGAKPKILALPYNKSDESVPEKISNYAYANKKQLFTSDGKLLKDEFLGVEIWLPTKLIDDNNITHYLPYSTVSITGASSWVKTPLAERRGSVKELFSVDDYMITIKGFFIDKDRRLFPENDLSQLKYIHEKGRAMQIKNALIESFLEESDKVVLESFDLPEVHGGRKDMRPFTMKLASDSVFELKWNG